MHAPVSLSQNGKLFAHRGSNLFHLIDEALLETMMEQGPLEPGEELVAEHNRRPTKAHVHFRVTESEPGATAAIVNLELGTSKKTRDGSTTGEVNLIPKGNESVNPYIDFSLVSPLNENSSFVAKVEIRMLIITIATFRVDCGMCGGECAFKLFGKTLQWELPACPLASNWTMAVDLVGMKAPGGVTVNMDVKTLRTDDQAAVAWELMSKF
mmetsp:Transcript_24181/g.56300  ORF Transcript_24181/g.56300 Transcript_24181/m.56300 type:complete len:211 (+) Transcript_24181:254-886(+)